MTQDDQEMQDREPAEADAPEAQADGDGGGNPVKEMFLLAALYLPLGFFLWFYLASALMWLPARLSELVLTGLFPNIVDDVVQLGFHLEVQTAFVREAGQIALADKNPMLYAWGMALLFGLIMATPLKGKRRALQMLIGYLVVSLVTVWGVVFDVLKDIAFVVQPEGPAAIAQTFLSPTAIALCYQLGYLMFPAVIPMATWILMNRRFLEEVVLTRRI